MQGVFDNGLAAAAAAAAEKASYQQHTPFSLKCLILRTKHSRLWGHSFSSMREQHYRRAQSHHELCFCSRPPLWVGM